MSLDRCDPEVYKNGVSVGLFDMSKNEAELFCLKQTKETGCKHDWHYIGGRVHVKKLPTSN